MRKTCERKIDFAGGPTGVEFAGALIELIHCPLIGKNLYILKLYNRHQKSLDAVNEATRCLFNQWKPTEARETAIQVEVDLCKLIGVVNLAQSIRSDGYWVARLDPLKGHAASDPILKLDFHHLSQDDLSQLPADLVGLPEAHHTGYARRYGRRGA